MWKKLKIKQTGHLQIDKTYNKTDDTLQMNENMIYRCYLLKKTVNNQFWFFLTAKVG